MSRELDGLGDILDGIYTARVREESQKNGQIKSADLDLQTRAEDVVRNRLSILTRSGLLPFIQTLLSLESVCRIRLRLEEMDRGGKKGIEIATAMMKAEQDLPINQLEEHVSNWIRQNKKGDERKISLGIQIMPDAGGVIECRFHDKGVIQIGKVDVYRDDSHRPVTYFRPDQVHISLDGKLARLKRSIKKVKNTDFNENAEAEEIRKKGMEAICNLLPTEVIEELSSRLSTS